MTSGRNVKYMPATSSTQSFAAKLTDTAVYSTSVTKAARSGVMLGPPQAPATAPVSPQVSPPQPVLSSPKHHRPQQTCSAPPNIQGQFPGGKVVLPFSPQPPPPAATAATSVTVSSGRSITPIQNDMMMNVTAVTIAPSEYSLFNETFPKVSQHFDVGSQIVFHFLASVKLKSSLSDGEKPKLNLFLILLKVILFK